MFYGDGIAATGKNDPLLDRDAVGRRPAQWHDDVLGAVAELIGGRGGCVDAVVGWQPFGSGQAAFLNEDSAGVGAEQFDRRSAGGAAGRILEQFDALEGATGGRNLQFQQIAARRDERGRGGGRLGVVWWRRWARATTGYLRLAPRLPSLPVPLRALAQNPFAKLPTVGNR